MGITLPKTCEWVTKTMDGKRTECPPVPDTVVNFDWQCDPRIEPCTPGQYGVPIIVEYLGDDEDDVAEVKKEEEPSKDDEIDAAEEGLCLS